MNAFAIAVSMVVVIAIARVDQYLRRPACALILGPEGVHMRSIALAFLILVTAHTAHAEITEAKVTGGVVSGVMENGIAVFKGIPFAAPPVGDRRWQAPAPVTPWTGIKKADAFANACMQPPNSQGNTAPVSEDCLYLNVWTPASAGTNV